MTRLTFLLPALLVALTPASHAGDAPFASAAAKGALSSARLLSAGPPQAGVYHAGVEIDLDAGAITYWRQPGESGAPPVFDFSHSVNVAKVEPFFPAPKHIDEAGTTVAGYDSRVIFPLKVTPRDPSAPVKLNLALDYAACSKICLPGRADLSLELPREGSSPHAADIGEAERLVPKKLTAAEAKKRLALKRAAGDAAWRLVYLGPGKALDLFPEAPEPLFLDSKKVDDGFELTLFATGAKPKAADATLTIVTDQEAFEAPARLQ